MEADGFVRLNAPVEGMRSGYDVLIWVNAVRLGTGTRGHAERTHERARVLAGAGMGG
jgi:hypothetical protein